jgi:chromosome partitioning protein
MIDADPNRPIAKWARRPGKPQNLTVLDQVTEQTVIRTIDEAARQTPFVIVDLEGTASAMVIYAISRADLVIIPMQGSYLDGTEAASASRVVKQQEEAFGRAIPSAILLTRTNPAVRSRTLTAIEQDLARGKIPVFRTELNERDAYKALFSYGGTLETLDPAKVGRLPQAIKNAEAFAAEAVRRLKPETAARRAAAVA